jgi:hypothetical protein
MLTKTTVAQVSHEVYNARHSHAISTLEGERSVVLSEVEFSNGARLFLEFSEVTALSIDERSTMHHLFTHPSLLCRVPGGFSVWNTAHMVSWSHYPKLHIPIDSWVADSVPKDPMEDLKNVKFV